MGRLDGKVAIVTGTARGIGKAIARRYAAEGALVTGMDLLADLGEQSAAEVVADGARMDFQAGDVSQEADVRRIVRSVLDAHGRVDILVNNAGVQREAKLTDVTVEDFHAVVNVNLLGAVLLCREVLPGMVERRSGVIVNMPTSRTARTTSPMPVIVVVRSGLIPMIRASWALAASTYRSGGRSCPGR